MLSLLDRMGKRYGCLPCQALGIEPSTPLGLGLNLLALNEGMATAAQAGEEHGALGALLAAL
jgi:hypothetical protein